MDTARNEGAKKSLNRKELVSIVDQRVLRLFGHVEGRVSK